MKKSILLLTFAALSFAAFSQSGRLQVGLLTDITDTRVVDLSAHPTIRYYLTDHIQIGASGLYKKTGYTYTYKYLNLSARWYLGRSPYLQAGVNTDFRGNNLAAVQAGYTANFGRVWIEPYVNYLGVGDKDFTQINVGVGVGLSLN